MNKILAILGHKTRGQEVIEILEMLGGKNDRKYGGGLTDYAYSINEQGIIEWYIPHPNSPRAIFTLEEFLEKFPYKVGDKVLLSGVVKIIKQARWDDIDDEVIYKLETNIRGFSEGYYVHHYDLQPYKEEIIGETIVDTIKESKDRYRLSINYQYEIEVDEGEYYVVRRKPQYPKTYEECCDILQLEHTFELKDLTIDEEKLTDSFIRLKRCRDAYWKIAGEQMGLGKPWQPDYNEESYEQGSPIKYVIYYTGTYITKGVKCTPSHILAFPSEEMRDIFYENFKKLIEQCIEFL
jgi:hypothetical protein